MTVLLDQWRRLVQRACDEREEHEQWRARIILVLALVLLVSILPGVVSGALRGTSEAGFALVLAPLYGVVVWRLGRKERLGSIGQQLMGTLTAGCALWLAEWPDESIHASTVLVGPTAAFVLGAGWGWRWFAIQAGVSAATAALLGMLDPALFLVLVYSNLVGAMLQGLVTMAVVVNEGRTHALEQSNEQLLRAEAEAAKAHAEVEAERQRAEALAHTVAEEKVRLAGVLDNLPHAVYWRTAGGTLAGWNRGFEELTGDPTRGVALEEGRALVEEDLEILVVREPVLDRPERWIVQDVAKPVVVSRVPLPSYDGRNDGLLVIAQDVSVRRELEAQLATARRLEAVGQLAAGIAHEINTPAQYVGDNLEFLQQSFEDLRGAMAAFVDGDAAEAARGLPERLARIDFAYLMEEIPRALAESTDGMARVKEIVLGMKRFSHPSSKPTLADLNEAVQSTVVVSRNEWKYHAAVETRLDPELGLVHCIEGEIKQVLLNLVVNAAHAIAMRDESIETPGVIEIETVGRDDDVVIRVRDNGCGMTGSVRDRVFEPFFTTKPAGRGTGQGLALAHSIVVKTHRGRISVDSEPGVGTVLEVVLPRGPATASPSTPGPLPEPTPEPLPEPTPEPTPLASA